MSSRLADAILAPHGSAYGQMSATPISDLTYGGMHGWSPNLRQWVSNQAHVSRNLKAVLLTPPRFITLMQNPEKWYAAIKNLIETHPISIEGFNAALKPEFDEHPAGGAGEMQQELVDMKRARSEPVTAYRDKYGRPIQKLLEMWMLYGMMDPETKVAMVRTLAGVSAENPGDWMADWYTMTCMFYETDATEWYVDKAWICTNMMPMEMGDLTSKRDLTTGGEILSLSIPWTALSAYNAGTIQYAQQYHRTIMMNNANPMLRQQSLVDGIDPTVAAAPGGFKYTVERPDLAQVAMPL